MVRKLRDLRVQEVWKFSCTVVTHILLKLRPVSKRLCVLVVKIKSVNKIVIAGD